MIAFMHGNLDAVSWLVTRVSQFPDDEEIISYINSIYNCDVSHITFVHHTIQYLYTCIL